MQYKETKKKLTRSDAITMSLNNIQLDPSLLADMYKSSLIATNDGPGQGEKVRTSLQAKAAKTDPDTKTAKAGNWRYLGEFKKNILVIVRYNSVPYLPDEQLNFLSSVLGACRLNLGDVAILNTANDPLASYKSIQEKFKSSFTILFGLTPEEFEMPLSFPEFQVQPFDNCTFLHTPVLETLKGDKVLKSRLWVCLRKMFGV